MGTNYDGPPSWYTGQPEQNQSPQVPQQPYYQPPQMPQQQSWQQPGPQMQQGWQPQQPYQQGFQPQQQPPPMMINIHQANNPVKPKAWYQKPVPLILLIVGILGLCAMCGAASVALRGSGATNTGTVVNTSNSSSSAPDATTATAKHFRVGDVVSVTPWQITIQNVKTIPSMDGGAVTPKPGNTFLELTVSMKNVSNAEQTVSSLAQFNLIGPDGTKYSETINIDVAAPPDGKVEAGMPTKGTFTYEVPTSAKTFTFTFEAKLFAPGLTAWDISA